MALGQKGEYGTRPKGKPGGAQEALGAGGKDLFRLGNK